MTTPLTDAQVQEMITAAVNTALIPVNTAAANTAADLKAEVNLLKDRLAKTVGLDDVLDDVKKNLGVVPKKGSPEEQALVFPRHYERLNEIPRPVDFRRGCERMKIENLLAVQGFMQKKYFPSYDQLETMYSINSYLQDIFFASGDPSVTDAEYRLTTAHAVNSLIALARKKTQILVAEGEAAHSSAQPPTIRLAASLRGLWASEGVARGVTDPILRSHMDDVVKETMKAEAKQAAQRGVASKKAKSHPPGGRPEGGQQ